MSPPMASHQSQPTCSLRTSYQPRNNQDLSPRSRRSTDRPTSGHDPEQLNHIDSKTSFRHVATNYWLWEWCSWLVAFAAIAVITVILFRFNGDSVPDWPYGITLGALVSVMATFATICLTGPIASALGQTKWIWTTSERSMIDFEFIDQASRGPAGAANLVLRWKGGFLAIFGALLLIATQAVNPFSQQVVQHANKPVNASQPEISIAQSYDTFAADNGDTSLSMKAAIQRGGLDTTATPSTFFVTPDCPTGNCTWQNYTSLAVCARCADLTSELSVQSVNGTANATLPNNITLGYVPETTELGLVAMTIENPTIQKSIAFQSETLTIADIFTIVSTYNNDSQENGLRGPYASECILQYCALKLSSSSKNGAFVENTVGEPLYFSTVGDSWPVTNTENFTVEDETSNALSDYFSDLFNENVRQTDGLSPTPQWPDAFSQSLFYWTNTSADHALTEMFENIAASMTLNIRQASNLTQPGIATTLQNVIDVRWPWLALPYAVVLLTGLYLLAVTLSTRRRKIETWKNSELATLMLGLAGEKSEGILDRTHSLTAMLAWAETRRIILRQETSAKDDSGNSLSHHILEAL